MTKRASVRALLLPLHLLLLAACAPALARPSGPATTVLVVRHAERASETDRDPPLSPAGEARARALVEVLQSAGVTAVYATQYQRTQQTARPLAERLGLQVQVQRAESGEGAAQSAQALARELLSRHAGKTVLVVGHSNTVALIVRALGGGEVGPIQSTDYDNLFVVTVHPDGTARLIRARFGASG